MRFPTLALAPLLLAAISPLTSAQTVLGPGDDIQVAIDAAPDGATLLLAFDGEALGTLSWKEKSLTLAAAPGFAPQLRGGTNSPALRVESGIPETGVTLRDLELAPGAGSTIAVSLSPGTASSLLVQTALTGRLEQCRLAGSLDVAEIGFSLVELDLTVLGCEVDGPLNLVLENVTAHSIRIGDGCRIGGLAVGTFPVSGLAPDAGTLRIEDTLWTAPVDLQAQAEDELIVRRCVFEAESSLTAQTLGEVLIESTVLRGPGNGTGLQLVQFSDVSLVNCTAFGWDTAIETAIPTLPARLENLALFGNTVDLAGFGAAQQIRTCMTETGAFAGQNGNFQATPIVNAKGALQAGSPGIDAGTTSANGLGSADVQGNPRVSDGDEDGTVQVDIGAFELDPGPTCATATHVVFNGSGSNPLDYSVTGEAILGQAFQGSIAPSPTAATAASVLAIGSDVGFAYALPGIEGELFLDLSVLPTLNVASGTHVLPVPADPTLCGREIDTQALRVEVAGGVVTTRALNGATLTLGQP